MCLALLVHSCSVKKFIPEDELLYTGADVKLHTSEKVKGQKDIQLELEDLLRPEPNSKILGMRVGLYSHYKAQREKPGFIQKFLNKKVGEEPVYLSDVDSIKTMELINNRLENRGFFNNIVSSKTNTSAKTASIDYRANVGNPYLLETYQLDTDALPIYREIAKSMGETVLKKGERYDLSKMKLERERLDADLKGKGYYNFNADFLIFEADTNRYDTKRFDLFLRMKKDVPEKSKVPYVINSVKVYPNYSIDKVYDQNDTIDHEGIDYIQDTLFFKAKRLAPYVLLKEGDTYDPMKSKLTSNRLSSIGTYKFVNIRYAEVMSDSIADTTDVGRLDAHIYLYPLNKRAIRTELQAVSKSNNFAGPSLVVTYSNRNLFHGGEILNITAEGGYEKQLGGKNSAGLSSTKLGLNTGLIFPRLLFPITLEDKFDYAVPKTKVGMGVEYLKRSGLYSLNSFSTTFGYTWNANKYVYHELNPISVNFVRLSNTTPEFEEILSDNPYLRSSFEQQFIAGLTYSYTYSEISEREKNNPVFFNFNLDLAGNLLSLLDKGKDEEGNNTFLGSEYAQYSKFDVDFRYYFNLGPSQTLVTRLFGGIGFAYGNSTALPFPKQYFSGGPYSVRAFRIRSLGPGTYESTSTNASQSFFDRSGDIRLEANLEYRFPLYSFLKGALFADAGNVWLLKENESLPGGKFTSNFTKELGVGVGAGLRVDIQNFVIRFDLAVPVSKPFLPEGERLDFDFNNPVLNFAIGYPF
ncbi:MAG: BamA/TamA family outer membrane protein [Sediminicola sp.]